MEVLIEKTVGKTTGWIGYTLSKSDRKFENLNFGETFPAKYDRRHDISFVMTHKFNDRIDIGATWVFGTGNNTTLALQKYSSGYYTNKVIMPQELSIMEEGIITRMPNYHRMDIAVNFHRQKKHGTRTWSLGVYNAYNCQNPFYLYWGHNTTSGYSDGWYYEDSKRALKQVSLFPLIPSITYSFKF